MTWNDGIEYEGDWVCGYAEGKGKLSFPNGDYMKGDFRYNKLNGEGEIYNANNNEIV